MRFNNHGNLKGKHASFSPSKCSWLGYSEEKAVDVYRNQQAAELGTKLHAWAKETIDLGIKQPRSQKTLYSYVNDAIGFHMDTEVILYYSDLFFGTADAISFRQNTLRIHDLKTGVIPGNMNQLKIYAALFCLEYCMLPKDISIILRIYQSDQIIEETPEPTEIYSIMDQIMLLNKRVTKYIEEGFWK